MVMHGLVAGLSHAPFSRWAENQKLILAAKAAGKPKPDIKRYVRTLCHP